MCWATNSIGRMDEPCIFHLIPAGRPDPVLNCTVVNQTYSTLLVVCQRGFDGGLPQDFTMEVKDAKTSFVVGKYILMCSLALVIGRVTRVRTRNSGYFWKIHGSFLLCGLSLCKIIKCSKNLGKNQFLRLIVPDSSLKQCHRHL